MLKLDWPAAERPKPAPRPLPSKPARPWPLAGAAALGITVVLLLGIGAGRLSVADEIASLETRITADENLVAATTAERDHWRSEAESATAAYEAIESDVASLTATMQLYAERSKAASDTIAALKAENARLQQMKSTPAKGAATTVASTSGYQTARVSWYGPGFYGHKTASGAVLTQDMMNVAHKTLAFGTRIEFRYQGRTCVAVVNDRGPFVAGRTFDLGPGTAAALGFSGVGTVEWRVV